MKKFIAKGLVKILSLFNRLNQNDLLEKFEKIIALANGKHRGAYDINHEINIIKNLIKENLNSSNGCMIDIGANVGDYTDLFLNKFPNFDCYLFEPQAEIFNLCSTRFSNLKNVQVFNYGLFTCSKNIKIFKNHEDTGLASIYDRKHEINEKKKYEFHNSETIALKRFDELNLHLETIDFVKIDVEGAELEVLEGFGQEIKKVSIIQFEFGRAQLDSKKTFLDYYNFFTERDFSIYRMHPSGIKKINYYSWFDEIYVASNFVCINNSI